MRLLLPALLLAACAAPPALDATRSPTLVLGGTSADAFLHATPRLTGLADAPLTGAGLAENDDGRLALSLLATCALAPGAELDVPTSCCGAVPFFGELGLAPGWTSGGIGRRAQLVTACALAHLSVDGLPAVASLRGPGLPVPADERAAFSVSEGRFFGQALGDGPPVLAACRGAGQLADPGASGLDLRRCAAPDPARPGLTLCGLRFAGECAAMCSGERCEVGGERYAAIASYVAP